jgi:alkyl sulfatase BDS1-like metallo-beta-lactamase superfamily hydrolase
VHALGRWAARSPTLDRDAPMGVDSTVLALRSLFDADAASELRASYELRLGNDRFHIQVADGDIQLGRSAAPQPDAIIDTDPDTLQAVLWSQRPLTDALGAGDLRIQGDTQAVERLVRLAPLPPPATPAQVA